MNSKPPQPALRRTGVPAPLSGVPRGSEWVPWNLLRCFGPELPGRVLVRCARQYRNSGQCGRSTADYSRGSPFSQDVPSQAQGRGPKGLASGGPFCTFERTVSRPARLGHRAGQLWACTPVCTMTWPFVSTGTLPLLHPFSRVWRTWNSLEARKTSSVLRAALASYCAQTRPFQPQTPGHTAPGGGRGVPTQSVLPGPAADTDRVQDRCWPGWLVVGPLLGWQTAATSLCLHMAFPPCVHPHRPFARISRSCQDPSPVRLGPTLTASF